MNGPLLDDLLDQLRGAPSQQLGQHLGLPQDTVMQAVSTALPVLLGAMHRNARSPDGAASLLSALELDHRGVDPTNALATALAGGGSGGGILRHLFGPHRDSAPQAVGQAAGLEPDRAEQLLRALAPMAMAYLARRFFTPRATDGASTPQPSPEGLQAALDREMEAVRERGGAAGLHGLLDRDHDGDVDLADFSGAHRTDDLGPLPTQTAEMRSPRPRL